MVWSCQALRLPFYSSSVFSPFLENGTTEINYSSPGWTIDSFCFPGVTAHSVLKVGLWICVLGLRDTYCINKYLSCRCTVINLILFLLIFLFSKLYMYSKQTCNKEFKSLNKDGIWFKKKNICHLKHILVCTSAVRVKGRRPDSFIYCCHRNWCLRLRYSQKKKKNGIFTAVQCVRHATFFSMTSFLSTGMCVCL